MHGRQGTQGSDGHEHDGWCWYGGGAVRYRCWLGLVVHDYRRRERDGWAYLYRADPSDGEGRDLATRGERGRREAETRVSQGRESQSPAYPLDDVQT